MEHKSSQALPDEPRKNRMFRMSVQLMDWLDQQAQRERVSSNELLTRVLMAARSTADLLDLQGVKLPDDPLERQDKVRELTADFPLHRDEHLDVYLGFPGLPESGISRVIGYLNHLGEYHKHLQED